jgi:hypothetical protein
MFLAVPGKHRYSAHWLKEYLFEGDKRRKGEGGELFPFKIPSLERLWVG